MMNDAENAIREAIAELDLQDSVVRVSEIDAGDIVESAAAKFVADRNRLWWWEALTDSLPQESITLPDSSNLGYISKICPSGPAYLFATDDGFPPWPVFRGDAFNFERILAECYAFEYAIVSEDMSWMVLENHHNVIVGIGAGVVESLRDFAA